MADTYIRDFTRGNVSKQLVTFAWPLFLSNLLQVLYNMVDMIVVGKTLGNPGLSAVSVGGDVTNLLTFVAMGFSSAGQVIIAQSIGRKERHKLGRFIGTMGGFLAMCAVALSVLGIIFQKQLLALMNTPEVAFSGAVGYSTVCMSGLVFIYGYNSVSAILRGMGDSKHPFIFICIAAVINLILDIVLVVFMDMGTVGAALATVTSQAVSFICSVVFLSKNSARFELDIKLGDFIFFERNMLEDLLKLGIPMAIKSASVIVSKLFVNSWINSWINSYGVAVSAFSGVANKIASVANLISMALNSAGSTMVGQNIAAREYKRVKSILKNLAVITVSIALLLSAAIILFPEQIFGIFTKGHDAEVLAIAHGYIPIAILLFFGAASRAIMNALINGSGNYGVNFATAILDGIVLRIGLSVLFGLVLDMRHYGFWLGDALAGFTPFWIGIVFYFTGAWKKERKKKT